MTTSLLVSGVGLAVLALLVAGCGDDDDAPAHPPPADLGDGIESSASVPSDVDVRLQRRITDPLPDEVVVRFQRINRGPDPRINLWWELTADGDVYLTEHSADTSDPDTPFATARPQAPTGTLDPDHVAEITTALATASFADQPGYQLDPGVEDGTFYVVTARLADGAVREVVYEGVRRAPIDTLETITERIVEGS